MAGAWQQQPIDLIGIFQAAQQANANREMMELRKADDARQERVLSFQQEEAQRKEEVAKQKAEYQLKVEEARRAAIQQQNDEAFRQYQAMDPKGAQTLAETAKTQQSMLPEADYLKPAAAHLAAEEGNEGLADYRVAIQQGKGGRLLQIAADMAKQKERESAARGTKITVAPEIRMPGSDPLTMAGRTAAQAEARMNQRVLMKADMLMGKIAPDLFGADAKVKEGWVKLKDFLSEDWTSEKEQGWLGRKKAITSLGTSMLYDFIVAMSGKAVTDRERAMILKAIGDPESMTFHEYLSTLQAVQESTAAGLGLTRRELAMGVDTTFTPEQRQMIDEEAKAIGESFQRGDISAEEARAQFNTMRESYNITAPGVAAGGKPAVSRQGAPSPVADMSDEFAEEVKRQTELAEGGDANAMRWLEENVR